MKKKSTLYRERHIPPFTDLKYLFLLASCLFVFSSLAFGAESEKQKKETDRLHFQQNEVPAAEIEVRGIVVSDENEEPLAGATVKIKAGTGGTVTDATGQFVLRAEEDAVLVVSTLGYTSKEVSLDGQTYIKISLSPSSSQLEQLVVVGYGKQKEKNVTSAISSVRMQDIDQGAALAGTKILQGRVSGAHINSPSGIPGEKPIVHIRGIGSITGTGQPLYVVDGMPLEELPDLNPNDIESMDVLKDAAASAIYGSRANDGVVIITTKSGGSGKSTVHLSTKYGRGKIFNEIPMANTQEYIKVMRTAVENYNKQMGTDLDFYVPDQIEETNWLKEVQRNAAVFSSIHLDFSGGTDKSTYYTSFGYLGQEGIMRGSDYKQYNMRANLTQDLFKFMKLKVNLSGSAAPRHLIEQGDISLKNLRNAREEQPWYSPFHEDGSYKDEPPLIRHNPIEYYKEEDWQRQTYQGLGTVSLEISPIAGLTYTPSISAFGQYEEEKKKLTDKLVSRATHSGWGALSRNKNTEVHYAISNVLNYENVWGPIDYSVMAGHSYERNSGDLFNMYSSNYANNAFPSPELNDVTSGAEIFYFPDQNGYETYNLESYFGRLVLNYKDRYILNATVRNDGSSRFSKDKRYGTFPAASVAWRISNENFWTPGSTVNDLKLRLTYGTTGSMSGVGNFDNLSLVKSGNAYNEQGALDLDHNSRDLTWEKAKQIDVGIDGSLLGDRIYFSADYFHQRTDNLLFDRPMYSTSGYTSIPSNVGSLENSGIEFAVNAHVLTGDLKWNVGANISAVKNKLVALYGDVDNYVVPMEGWPSVGGLIHILQVGRPISSYYMYKMEGIYQRDEEVPQKLYDKGVRAGDVKYEDVNGDGDITIADKQILGSTVPDFYGGFTTDLQWKGFALNVFSQFSVGNKLFASWRGVNEEGTEHLGDASADIKISDTKTVEQFFNVSKKAATSYWDDPGSSNSMPRPVRNGVFTGYATNYNTMESSRFLEDASYFRIKTITLSYQIPTYVVKKVFLNDVRLFFTVDNAFTITGYSGYDPEQSFARGPGASNYGVDFGEEASLRNFIFGIDINF